MKCILNIPAYGSCYVYKLLSNCDFQVINLPNVVHIEIFKRHNHWYEFSAFFYEKKILCWPRRYHSKKELFCAIQKLLQINL